MDYITYIRSTQVQTDVEHVGVSNKHPLVRTDKNPHTYCDSIGFNAPKNILINHYHVIVNIFRIGYKNCDRASDGV